MKIHHARIRAALLGLVFFWIQDARAQLPPEKAEKTFTVSPGLEFKLWASEPLFSNPTTITVDHKGRVWVCEAVNYRRRLRGQPPLRKEGDRILVLEDTNLDGQADKVTTFYQAPEVESPLGIAILPLPGGVGQRVFVCQSPNIWTFEDFNGDLKADGPPKILLKGFQGIDHDHGVHGVQIGPDGRLWFTVGDAGVKNLQSSDGKGKTWNSNGTDCRAGTVWSCKLDGTDLVRYAHNFRNNYMACVDSFRGVFLSDNDDDGNQQTRICFVMPDGNYGYHPRGPGQTHWHEEQPGVVPKILRTGFGSPTGICVYEGDLLPKAYQGALLHTDAGPRQVRAYRLNPKGAGYEVESENIVTSTDPWFRPSDVQVAPDGAVFVSDWYDPGVGGHGMGDTTRGRIYRLSPRDNKPRSVAYDFSKDEGILDALASPNLAQRAGSIEAIRSRGKGLFPQLLKYAQEPGNPYWRARILGLLAEMSKDFDGSQKLLYDHLLSRAFEDKDTRLAQLAIRVDPRFSKLDDGATLIQLAGILKPPSAPIFREMLLASRHTDPQSIHGLFQGVVKAYQADDIFLLKALNICAGTDPQRRDAVMEGLDEVLGPWSDRVAQLVFELRPASFKKGLEARLADPAIPAAQRADLVGWIAAEDDPASGKLLAKLLAASPPEEVRQKASTLLAQFLEGKWSSLSKDQEFATLLGRIPDKAVWAQLVGAAKMVEAAPELDRLAEMGQPLERKAALAALGRLDTPAALKILEQKIASASHRASALEAMGQLTQIRGSQTGKAALELLKKETTAPDAELVVSLLALSREGSDWLLGQKDKLPTAAATQAGRLLRNSPYQMVRNKAMIAFPAPGKMDMAKLPQAAVLAKRTGRPEVGKKLLEASAKNELQCLKCHRVMGQGGDIGPDLSLIGKKASKENLLDSLLTPSKAIADQYIVHAIATKKGQTISGLLIEESPTQVTLRDGNGKDHRFPVSEIDERTKSKVSLMPVDLVAWMTEDDLVDLVEYLLTLKTGSITPNQWSILGPLPDDKGTALGEATAVEKGNREAVLKTKQGQPARWQAIRPQADGYLDLAAFHGSAKDQSYSYLETKIKSEVDQAGTLLLGADDGSRLWVNGTLVHEQNGKSAASPGMFRIPVKLKAGTNTILLKLTNGDGPHGAYLTVLGEGQLSE